MIKRRILRFRPASSNGAGVRFSAAFSRVPGSRAWPRSEFSVDMVAAVNPEQNPAFPLHGARQFAPGDRLHMAISITRSLPVGCAGVTSTERHPSTASRRFASSSSIVSPCVAQPGIAGTSAQYPPSSASWMTALSFIVQLCTEAEQARRRNGSTHIAAPQWDPGSPPSTLDKCRKPVRPWWQQRRP